MVVDGVDGVDGEKIGDQSSLAPTIAPHTLKWEPADVYIIS
jgi:hypothetical protein